MISFLDFCGEKNSFTISFNPSKTGWIIPNKKILLGPRRAWVKESNFRSSKVKKAILNKIKIKEIKKIKKKINILIFYL